MNDKLSTSKYTQYESAYAKPATVIASTARYDEICGGAGPSVTTIFRLIRVFRNNISVFLIFKILINIYGLIL